MEFPPDRFGKYTFSRSFFLRRPQLTAPDGKTYRLSVPAFDQLLRCIALVLANQPDITDYDGFVNYIMVRAVGASRHPASEKAKEFLNFPPALTVGIYFSLPTEVRAQLMDL